MYIALSLTNICKFSVILKHFFVKDLSINYKANYNSPKQVADFNLVIDIFAKPNQKIVVTGSNKFTKSGDSAVSDAAVIEIKSQVR